MNSVKLKKDSALLVVVDMQEKLVPAMGAKKELIDRTSVLCRGAKELDLPILVTQQYTKGLGKTIDEIADIIAPDGLSENDYIDKTDFSVLKDKCLAGILDKLGKEQIILAGIETHICIMQSCIDLILSGYDVFIAEDCMSSRRKRDHINGLKRMQDSGAHITTAEAALMEMIGGAKNEHFRAISNIIK